MSAIEDLATRLGIQIDPSRILSPEVKTIESTRFTGECVYKYRSAERREFFTAPQARFTQKAGMNDPFELTRRWHEFGSPIARDEFASFLKTLLREAMNDDEFLLAKLLEKAVRPATDIERDLLRSAITSDQFQALRRDGTEGMMKEVDLFMSVLFSETFGDELIEKEVEKTGIFSVSETATSSAMWGHYADNGRGYVVEFNAQHQFFRSDPSDGKDINLLRKVMYTDNKIPNFWSNPYFLFLVKETDWAFEREWRLIKHLDECRWVGVADGVDIFVRDLEPGVIRSLIFGYNYDDAEMLVHASSIKTFDSVIELKQANLDSGRIVIKLF